MSTEKPAVGFIGLGAMGVGMAKNIVTKDYPLTVMGHSRREPVERLLALGAAEAKTPADLTRRSDIIIICVTTSEVVENLVYGADGILAAIDDPILLIDCGTSMPHSTLKIGADLKKHHSDMLDVPLGRSAREAESGDLNMMVGGDKAVFERARPLLETMAENIFHLGELGVGHKIKLLNNFFAMSSACLLAEAVAAAKAIDLDINLLNQVMTAGPLKSQFMEWVMSMPLEGDDSKLQFAIKNGRKDVGYFVDMINDAGMEGLMSQCSLSMLDRAISDGLGEKTIPNLTAWFADSGPS